jgi:TrmH family RNA methyltransferase
MKTIVSRTNPDIQFVVSLHKEKNRTLHKMYLAEGLRTCKTLIHAHAKLKQVYVTEALLLEAQLLLDNKYITLVTEPVMEKISTTKTPSGMLGIFSMPAQVSFDQITAGLVLTQISDPGNMGTLIRSCAAMGCSTVVVIDGTDPWSPKVVQASAGTIAQVNILQTSWHELVNNKSAYKLCALVVKDGKKPDQIDFDKTLLVVGNEAHGIPDAWLKDCDEQMTIAMPGNVESLNAAVAGSIALYLAFVH